MDCAEIRFIGHAVSRIFERSLSRSAILDAVDKGIVIAEYPDDKPYPSCLLLSFDGNAPIHVVVGTDSSEKRCIIITVYRPDPAKWTDDFKRRRTS